MYSHYNVNIHIFGLQIVIIILESNILFKQRHSPGDSSAGATPVPIPNTAVKPCSADDTTQWESRSSPGLCLCFLF